MQNGLHLPLCWLDGSLRVDKITKMDVFLSCFLSLKTKTRLLPKYQQLTLRCFIWMKLPSVCASPPTHAPKYHTAGQTQCHGQENIKLSEHSCIGCCTVALWVRYIRHTHFTWMHLLLVWLCTWDLSTRWKTMMKRWLFRSNIKWVTFHQRYHA